MTNQALSALLVQYQSGLNAELKLLGRLEGIAARQEHAGGVDDLDRFHAAADERDRVMEALLAIEQGLVPIRRTLTEHRAVLAGQAAFESVAALHRHTAQRVAAIVAGDERTLESFRQAERSRRSALQTLEQGEQTLAAYRRVVAPTAGVPALISRKG